MNPIYTNKLVQALPQDIMPQQQVPPESVQEMHVHLTDMQDEFKKLLKLPDSELTISKIIGAASDLVTKHALSGKKRGADAMTVASELASKDFPREKNGQPPSPAELRSYLLRHFLNHVRMQAALTTKFAPPQTQVASQAPVNGG